MSKCLIASQYIYDGIALVKAEKTKTLILSNIKSLFKNSDR
jgi:hypothetical protein